MAQSVGRRPPKTKKQGRQKRKREDVDVEKLQQAVEELDSNVEYTNFTDLPLSAPTLAGLKSAHFSSLTPIQSKTIAKALGGSDILGAAKTGSGKTLAFLVPVLENLYRSQCIGADAGLGAMIISPTRELAVQIFEVLLKIGQKGHMFSAGLVIGGKSLQEEQNALVRMNIVVCTPGRMLQHLSQTAMFNCDNLQMLVLDEADRIMDMGFQRDVDAILDYLPADRQTLLFSATQTKRVSDLARLSLKDPEYISTAEASESATPKGLQQNYIVTSLGSKLDTLWSFLQSSKRSKILVFLSSGKQVRFVYEAFRHMQPGIPLLHLLGRQKQTTRMEITAKFSAAKTSCLFATDVVARGLDFPAVDWVVQVDCPEDADTYIHRVGRTARYERDGRAVLFLDPSEEEGMLSRLEGKKIPIERINVRQKKQTTIQPQLQNMCFKDPALKYLGQKAFSSYARSIYLQKDREVFHMDKMAWEEYATSLGLPGAPKIRFVDGANARERKNAPRMADESESDEPEESGPAKVRTKYDRMFERRNQDILAEHYKKMVGEDDLLGDEAADDDLFDVKQRIPADQDLAESHSVSVDGITKPIILDSKRREKLLKSKKKLLKLKEKGTKLVFDDEGNAHPIYELEDENKFKAAGTADEQRRQFVESEAQKAREADQLDKANAKEKRRAKKEKRKEREREVEEASENGIGEDVRANFLADAEALSDDERPKKWFEEEGRASTAKTDEPQTLEDLEALASGLIG